ncbi:major capsid protein [Nitrosomonas sp.]|uniref:major capsid protein n=1 Tax=Nitrosomonas sp. TaxID=42353 RepID=UPI00284D9E24|nr:major capsid protein [Nitrosomonas sp.]MDR4513152.1 major capsid protein [Nitrosomonas sp.]
MFKKVKDVVMTLGCSVKETLNQGISYVKSFFSKPAIEGEYIAKGAVNLTRRAFLIKSTLIPAFAVGFILLPTYALADIATDVASAVTTFGEVNAAIPVVGAAFLAALGLMAAWKLIRGAFA